jgi:hypothetical protein
MTDISYDFSPFIQSCDRIAHQSNFGSVKKFKYLETTLKNQNCVYEDVDGRIILKQNFKK